jgi:4-hydroxy-tetrahydrodipicolinate reductase
MKIALLGYGKMGKMIAEIASDRGHEIVLTHEGGVINDFNGAQVAIDFSTPESAVTNILMAFSKGVPVICGTTGWLDQMEVVKAACLKQECAFIYASNFSLGVNLFFKLNEQMAALMKPHAYHAAIEEIHHIHKLDAPSGTAITLAEGVIAQGALKDWSLVGNSGESVTNKLPITSKREGEVPGTHIVSYASDIDRLEIKHIAHNRTGFALGAVVAAEWIQNKKGIFNMSDVLA